MKNSKFERVTSTEIDSLFTGIINLLTKEGENYPIKISFSPILIPHPTLSMRRDLIVGFETKVDYEIDDIEPIDQLNLFQNKYGLTYAILNSTLSEENKVKLIEKIISQP